MIGGIPFFGETPCYFWWGLPMLSSCATINSLSSNDVVGFATDPYQKDFNKLEKI